MRHWAKAATVIALLALAFAGWRMARSPALVRPDVVLVTVDTLRRVRLGCYGSTTTRTPNIDRLAAEGTLFANATCPMPMTRPSHFSMFTSVYPRDHGVLNNGTSLAEDRPVLPELFRRAGYRTAAFVGVSLFDRGSGASRGFEVFDFPSDRKKRAADEVVPRATKWLRSHDPAEPFFLWVHLFDPHLPYAVPVEGGVAATSRVDWETLSSTAESNDGDLPRDFYRRALSLYDAEVERVDHWLGVLFETLKTAGVLNRTIVAFTADHGECFDHGIFFEHSDCLYDSAVLVPLIFRWPGGIPAGARRAVASENIDVAPTLLALAGLPAPSGFLGRALLSSSGDGGDRFGFLQHPLYSRRGAAMRSERLARLRSVGGEPTRPLEVDPQVGLRGGRWKYLEGSSRRELYDLAHDPGELRDLAPERPDVVNELHGYLAAWLAAHPLRSLDGERVDADLRDTLRALGYVQ